MPISDEELKQFQDYVRQSKKKKIHAWEENLTPDDLELFYEFTELFTHMSQDQKKTFLAFLKTLKKPLL